MHDAPGKERAVIAVLGAYVRVHAKTITEEGIAPAARQATNVQAAIDVLMRRPHPGAAVDLSRAELSGTDFRGATLGNVDLARAELGRADLRGADVSKARNLTTGQIRCALVDQKTTLPSGVERPDTHSVCR
ncbi:pentapeptide repeat-containing protein [Actinoplanes sp. CA-051413]|uniref:pentapeptide repeat-containing protein n=1 Tax=Actinoplanes sp. CA-051413 TaxID=3239899 RepID=UPI003D95A223